MEDELDDNLDEISEMTKRLKALGSAMGQELDTQNSRIDRIEGKTVNLDQKIFTNTERVSCPDLTFSLFLTLTIPKAQAHQVSSGPWPRDPCMILPKPSSRSPSLSARSLFRRIGLIFLVYLFLEYHENAYRKTHTSRSLLSLLPYSDTSRRSRGSAG